MMFSISQVHQLKNLPNHFNLLCGTNHMAKVVGQQCLLRLIFVYQPRKAQTLHTFRICLRRQTLSVSTICCVRSKSLDHLFLQNISQSSKIRFGGAKRTNPKMFFFLTKPVSPSFLVMES